MDEPSLVRAGVPAHEARALVARGLMPERVGHLEVVGAVKRDDDLVLAFDMDTPMVVRNGRVWAVYGDEVKLVNSSVCAFLDTLERYAQHVRAVLAVDTDEEEERQARVTQQDFMAIDPAAFADDDAYWPVTCEDMIDGCL